MHTTITTTEVLNTLIKVNNERITMYHRAIRAMTGTNIAPLRLFRCMITESEQYRAQLEQTLKEMGTEPDCENESTKALVANIWGDLLDTLSRDKLTLCEVEKALVHKAYEHALSLRLDNTIARMLYEQHEELKISYYMVKGCTSRQAVLH
ncbi:MAG: family four-helix-bundle protein [Flavipsychrobacter sp.]|jgi:hypothetical protein|nr:family four-helix-bundle protein [Flavipsychrobacter sp.]